MAKRETVASDKADKAQIEKEFKPSPAAVKRVSEAAVLKCVELDESESLTGLKKEVKGPTIVQYMPVMIDLVAADDDGKISKDFDVYCSFGAREIPEEQETIEDPELLFQIVATFHLGYQLKKTSKITKKDLLAFSTIVVVRTAWPYWREFAQNMTVRMGVSPVMVPLLPPPGGERVKVTTKK